MVRHELPNASIPAITAAGIIVAHLVGGAVIVEYVFARPGLGTLLVDSVYQRDYGVLQTLVLIAVAVFIITSLVVDVILGFIDPRLRTKAVTLSTAAHLPLEHPPSPRRPRCAACYGGPPRPSRWS